MWGYIALYETKKGDRVVVKTLTEPPKTRTLRGQGGLRKYKRVRYKKSLQEVVFVAKSTKSKSKKGATVTDDEIDELETVDDLDEEDLDDDEDLDEDEDTEDEDDEEEPDDEEDDEEEDDEDEEDDDEDDEEEEAPKSKSKKSKKSKKRPSRAAANGKVGTQEIAEASGVDGRRVRMVLRKHKVKKDEETGRYEWPSMNHKTVQKILKWLEAGEADEIVKESLDKLKAKKEAEKKDAAKKTKKSGKNGKKSGKKKKSKKSSDDDE